MNNTYTSPNKKIVVLGGGTAGWMTAHMIRTYYPDYDITVIHDSKIGVLGAGEGTTPNFVQYDLDAMGISFSELIKYCDATIKNGNMFFNWNGDNSNYFLSFNAASHNFANSSHFTDMPMPHMAYCNLKDNPSKACDMLTTDCLRPVKFHILNIQMEHTVTFVFMECT
jgi:hypothetical protein